MGSTEEIICDDEIHNCSEHQVVYSCSEIVEITEESSVEDRREGGDVYVAVGKDDLDVVKWALDHAVSPGARIFLIHVSSPITLIPTPGN